MTDASPDHRASDPAPGQPSAGDERITWRVIKDAIAGRDIDYTRGSLRRAIVLLAIPMMLEMFLEATISITDLFWVSRVSADAVAAAGLAESLLTVILAISSGLAVAATALVARRIGEKDPDKAATDAVQAIFVGLAISVALGVPLFFLAPKLLTLIGGTPKLVEVGSGYARIALGTNGAIIMLSLNNAIFRGAGNAATPMKILVAANILNLILDPLLIFGWGPVPALGVTGAAVTTLISRGSLVLYQFWLLARGSDKLKIGLKHLRPHAAEGWKFVRVSAGGMLQFFLEQGSLLALVRIVALFGAGAITGYTIAYRALSVIMLPSIGLSNAAGTLVGQNVGAGRHDRAKSAVWQTGWLNLAFLGSLSALFLVFAKPIVALFSHGEAPGPEAVEALRYFCAGNFLFAFGAVFLQAFNGAGDTKTPSWINFVAFWVVELPLAYGLSQHTGLKLAGVFVAILAGRAVALLAGGWLFVRGGWMKQKPAGETPDGADAAKKPGADGREDAKTA